MWSRYNIESLFLTAECLSAWLRVMIPEAAVPDADLQSAIRAAITGADQNTALVDAARDRMMIQFLRRGEKPVDANKLAREAVRSDPATYQRGHDRAAMVPGGIRRALPVGVQREVRATIADLIGAAKRNAHVGQLEALIPAEIRELLAWIVGEP